MAVECRGDRRARRRRDQGRPSGADGGVRGARQSSPEQRGHRVRRAPLLHDGPHLCIGANVVVAGDAPPCSDRPAEAAGQFGALAHLTLGLADVVDALAQHLRRDLAIGVQPLVAGRVVFLKRVELPGLAGVPRQHAALDRGEVDADEHVPRLGAQSCAHQLADDGERVAVVGKLGEVAGDQRVDQVRRELCIVAGQVVQLRAGRTPAPGRAAVDAQGVANARVAGVRVRQQARGRLPGLGRAALAQG